ncbi:MAG: LamG-like jellyroll fold domain-containing protein [Pirellulaceae bacterium]
MNDYVDTGKWDIESNAVTISLWFRADDFAVSDGRLLSKATGVQEQDHFWMLSTVDSSGMKLRFRLKTNDGTSTLNANRGNWVVGEWMHAAAVYDGSAMRLYLNGEEVGSMPKSGPIAVDAAVSVLIGNNAGQAKPFHGNIDEVQVYNRSLSLAEIQKLMRQSDVPNQPPTVNAGADASVNLNTTLTLHGSATDDGLPNPPAAVSAMWSEVQGPGAVHFSDVRALSPNVSFSAAGTYILRLTATDGVASVYDEISITVNADSTMAAFWPLNEGSGLVTADASGNLHQGQIGESQWGSGISGKGLWFDGVNDFVDTGRWGFSSNAMTISGWIRADSFVGDYRDGRIVSKAVGDQAQDHTWMLSTIAQGAETRLRFRLNTDGHVDTLVANSGNLVPGGWYHVAAVYDGDAMRLYLNGQAVGSLPKTGTIPENASVPVWIGNNPVSHAQPFHGAMDEMRIYRTALTALEITALAALAPNTPTTAANQAPIVDAGPNRNTVVSTSVNLDGTVTDDGLPSPVRVTWSKLDGPGTVSFGNMNAVDTTARFDKAGTYSLQLLANDGQLETKDTVTVVVTDANVTPQQVSGFFVSPSGTANGDGSLEHP